MSWATAYIAARDAVAAHVVTAWTATIWRGAVQTLPQATALPAASVLKGDSPTQEENITPTRKTSMWSIMVTGVWPRPVDGTDLESYAAARAEEFRDLLDADNHLGNLVNHAQVVAIDWQLPNAGDPHDGRLYVMLEVAIEMEYAR